MKKELYINGELTGGSDLPSVAGLKGYDVFIGAYLSEAQCFSGSIDEVKIYNKALGAEAIRKLYEEEKTQIGKESNVRTEKKAKAKSPITGDSLAKIAPPPTDSPLIPKNPKTQFPEVPLCLVDK